MHALQNPTLSIRVTGVLAAVATTGLIVGSQLVIADGYTQRADAELAAKAAQRPIALQMAPAQQIHH